MTSANAIVLDDIPRPVWFVLMILGFVFFWPIGLLILGYLMWSGKMRCGRNGDWHSWKTRAGFYGSTGNHAFDDYRDATLRRLEDEAREFGAFVDRLRRAKDKEEFDRFMSERSQVQPTGGQSTL
jgi:hypothetical protein